MDIWLKSVAFILMNIYKCLNEFKTLKLFKIMKGKPMVEGVEQNRLALHFLEKI